MANETSIVQSTGTGDEVAAIAAKIIPVINGENQGHTIMALIGIAMMLQYPPITDDQLTESVEDVSRYMCLLCDGYVTADQTVKAN